MTMSPAAFLSRGFWLLCLLAPAAAQQLSPTELSIWNDPAFQRRFAESYLAETDVEPRLDDDEREQMQELLALIAANRLDEAALRLEGLAGGSRNAVFDFTLAQIRFQQEKLDQAASRYSNAIEKFPRFRRAHRSLGLIHVRNAEFAKAVPALTRVVELGGGDAATYGLLGYSYAVLDNPLAAESAYRMANLLDPNALDWKMGLARSFFKQGRFADAAALTATLLSSYADRADLWLLQANAYLGLEQPRKAAENLEIVDRLGKATAESLTMLGDIHVNLDQFELAVQAHVRALEKAPQGKAERAIRAARALVARGGHDPARELMAAIQKLRGDTLPADEKKDLLKLRARLAVAAGAGDEEAEVLAEIVAIDPLDGEALILLGQHAGRTGDTEKAVFWFERAAGLEKFEADAKVRHAQLLVGQGKYQEALPLLRRAQTLKPRETIQQYLEQVERVAQSR
jgi:tetratricopeptide (TPR) repeat protein